MVFWDLYFSLGLSFLHNSEICYRGPAITSWTSWITTLLTADAARFRPLPALAFIAVRRHPFASIFVFMRSARAEL